MLEQIAPTSPQAPGEPKMRTPITQAMLRRLEAEGRKVEVDQGMITEVLPVTLLHVWIIQSLYDLLKPFTLQLGLGYVFVDGFRYRLFGSGDDIQTDYIPDLSFLRIGRLPTDLDWNDDFPGYPDLAVEVASPGQSQGYMLKRAGVYLDAGTEEIWLIFPAKRELHQYRMDSATEHSVQVFKGDDEVTSPLFAGFSFRLASIFVTPAQKLRS